MHTFNASSWIKIYSQIRKQKLERLSLEKKALENSLAECGHLLVKRFEKEKTMDRERCQDSIKKRV